MKEDNFYREKYNLLIVESPTKAATIKKYLKETDEEWVVLATKGHIFDLPIKNYGLKFEDEEIVAQWEFVSEDTEKILKEIAKIAKKADMVFIATDDDREGERIASDVAGYLNIENYTRVVFHEITQKSVLQELYASTREIDTSIVEAAKANRFIDRELGWKISNIMGNFIKFQKEDKKKGGTGRVIAPALALLCTKEKELSSFVTENYNMVVIDYVYNGRSFRVYNASKFLPEDEIHLNRFVHGLQTSKHSVSSYEEKIEDVAPHKPLNTPSLQYSAWYVLGIMPDITMRLAQRLFEIGLITYHRTDSIRISDSAIKAIRNYIIFNYETQYLAPIVREFKPKKNSSSENIQDAHEAIRPTNFTNNFSPEYLKEHNSLKLSDEELTLYTLIWARTIITQMADAQYDRTSIIVTIGKEEFSARANESVFNGWEIVGDTIISISKIKNKTWKSKIVVLPKLKIAEELYPLEIITQEHNTQAPKRYGIGTFIEAVNTMGFARPSTIGTIIKRLVDEKNYVAIQKGILVPTVLGIEVDDWTTKNFNWLNDIQHAKVFEDELQKIERGEIAFGDSLVFEYKKKIDEVAERLGVNISSFESNLPSKAQIELINSIASKQGITVGEEIFNNKDKASIFISKYKKIDKIKKCPYCTKGDINEEESFFKCDNQECNFFITKKRIMKYFESKGKEFEEYELVEIVKSLTLKKGYKAEDLISKKGTSYSQVLVFDYSKEYGWGIEFLSNVNKKKEGNE